MNKPEYKCGVCAKNFISEKNLLNHTTKFHKEPKNEIVVENKPVTFACKICNKEYKSNQSRNNHEKTCAHVPITKKDIEPSAVEPPEVKEPRNELLGGKEPGNELPDFKMFGNERLEIPLPEVNDPETKTETDAYEYISPEHMLERVKLEIMTVKYVNLLKKVDDIYIKFQSLQNGDCSVYDKSTDSVFKHNHNDDDDNLKELYDVYHYVKSKINSKNIKKKILL
jgi:hypothetical protein